MIGFAMMHSTHLASRTKWLREIGLPAWHRESVEPVIAFDHRKAGIWDTCRRAWLLSHALGDTFGCVLQDDFTPCNCFITKCERFVTRHPVACIFQPATSHPEVCEAKMNRNQEFELGESDIAWGGSLVMPRDLILPTIKIADSLHSFGDMDDTRLTVALRIQGCQIWNVPRSLIRHDGAFLESYNVPFEIASRIAPYRVGYTLDMELS